MNATISQVLEAMNTHDAQRLGALFAADYRSEQPTHPDREYVGRDTLVAIWGDLFTAVPDLSGEVLAEVPDDGRLWVEWHWAGHYTDGSPFEMRGVSITTLDEDGLVAAQRLYAELVEQGGPGIEESERRLREPAR